MRSLRVSVCSSRQTWSHPDNIGMAHTPWGSMYSRSRRRCRTGCWRTSCSACCRTSSSACCCCSAVPPSPPPPSCCCRSSWTTGSTGCIRENKPLGRHHCRIAHHTHQTRLTGNSSSTGPRWSQGTPAWHRKADNHTSCTRGCCCSTRQTRSSACCCCSTWQPRSRRCTSRA